MRARSFVPVFVLAATLACKGDSGDARGSSGDDAGASAGEVVAETGYWKGAIALPGAAGQLEWMLSIQPAEDGAAPTAKLWIPMQGVAGVDLGAPKRVDDPAGAVAVTWPDVKATWTLIDGGDKCTFVQGKKLGCTIESLDAETFAALTDPKRPQTPQPPFPYTVEEVTFANPEAPAVELAGTLTIPEGDGPHPGVVLISGSGLQDRDETLFQHKPFWVLADHLSRNGIAVLRYDDRGAGKSKGDGLNATMVEFASDAWAAAQTLAADERVDAAKVGLIGHSEGGVTGPMVAVAHPDAIAFVVMLAGTGVRGDALVQRQTKLLLEAEGADEDKVTREVETIAAMHEAILAAPPGEANDAIEAVLREWYDGLSGIEKLAAGPVEEVIAPRIAANATPWLHHFLGYDPAENLRKLDGPVLVLNGELDLQVAADQNIPAIEAALADNDQVEVVRFPGLNHMFQPATKGTMSEYATIEITMDPKVLETIATWIAETTG